MAQTKLTITDPGIRGIAIKPHDSAGLAREVDPLLGSGVDATRLRPFAVVVENATANPVMAITLRWTWTDAAGQIHEHDLRSDGFFHSRRALVPAGGQIVFTPGAVLPVQTPRQGFVSSAIRAGREIENFERAGSRVTVALDAVVFADGEAVGPDRTRTVDYIQARNAAATALGRTVLAMQELGKDPTPHLAAIRSRGAASKQDYYGLWSFRLASRLLGVRDMKQYAQQLVEVQMPTLFRR